jgi:hypothetical protein
MNTPDDTPRNRGGIKMGLILWLLGAPILLIVLGVVAC